jgi:hypothetical protein
MNQGKFVEENLIVKVIDPSTKDVIATYDNYKQTSKALFATAKAIKRHTDNKSKFFSEHLGKIIVFRLARRIEAAA